MGALLRLAAAAAIIVFYRWSLHLSTPKADLRQVQEYASAAATAIRRSVAMLRVWLISHNPYVPSSHVQDAWLALRERFTAGRYGEAGT